jgi:hypothetical protein
LENIEKPNISYTITCGRGGLTTATSGLGVAGINGNNSSITYTSGGTGYYITASGGIGGGQNGLRANGAGGTGSTNVSGTVTTYPGNDGTNGFSPSTGIGGQISATIVSKYISGYTLSSGKTGFYGCGGSGTTYNNSGLNRNGGDGFIIFIVNAPL